MEFHFVKLNVNGTYLSLVDPSCKSRFVCFSTRETAEDCVEYISSFRSKYNTWPSFDMSKRRRKMKSPTNVKLRTPDQVKRYLEIETYDFNTIETIAARTNSSFYCVLELETITFENVETIAMSGREMDANVDERLYRDLLEYNLKIN